MKQKSLARNAFFNFLYTGLNIFFPLITAPYISRTLGASNLGKVNFATSIVNWFILFSVFGTASYGIREVARNRDDKNKLSKIFSEIIFINGFLSIVVCVLYIILVINTNRFQEDIVLYIIMSLSIIMNMFSIDWFYQGIEEYRYIIIRGAMLKIFSLIGIFLFVKHKDDYIIYGFISVASISLNGILNYIYSKKYVDLSFNNIHPERHFKSLFVFFISSLVINLYTNLDQTVLGFLVDTKSVAYMNRSRTVISAAGSIATSISNVTMPRASYYIKNNMGKFNELLSSVPGYILWITIPLTVGVVALAPNIMFILGGEEFLEAARLIQLISIVIVFSPLSGYLQNQILVPTGNERYGLYCAIFSGLISVILNFLLIPRLGYIGSGIAVVITEIVAVSSRLLIVKYKLNYKEINFFSKSTFLFVFASLFMGAIVLIVNNLIGHFILGFIVSAFIGSATYFSLLKIFHEKNTNMIFKRIKNRVV